MVIEMVEIKEIDTARVLLRDTQPMHALKQRDPDRQLPLRIPSAFLLVLQYNLFVVGNCPGVSVVVCRFLRLQRLLNKPYFDSRDAYPDGSTKEKRRNALAKGLFPFSLLLLSPIAVRLEVHITIERSDGCVCVLS